MSKIRPVQTHKSNRDRRISLSAKRNTAAVMESGQEKVSSRRVALVINASYQRIPRLANPRHDAQDVCATLKSLQFEVVCLYDVATRRDIRSCKGICLET